MGKIIEADENGKIVIEIVKQAILEALPKELNISDESSWQQGYNFCLNEITNIIEKFGKDEGEDEV